MPGIMFKHGFPKATSSTPSSITALPCAAASGLQRPEVMSIHQPVDLLCNMQYAICIMQQRYATCTYARATANWFAPVGSRLAHVHVWDRDSHLRQCGIICVFPGCVASPLYSRGAQRNCGKRTVLGVLTPQVVQLSPGAPQNRCQKWGSRSLWGSSVSPLSAPCQALWSILVLHSSCTGPYYTTNTRAAPL